MDSAAGSGGGALPAWVWAEPGGQGRSAHGRGADPAGSAAGKS
jgi:hypothetical protein